MLTQIGLVCQVQLVSAHHIDQVTVDFSFENLKNKKSSTADFSHMPRFINCRGCGNRHTGAGGSRCKFRSTFPTPAVKTAETNRVSLRDALTGDSPENRSYLESKMAAQEELLRIAEDAAKVADMERHISDLRI